MEEGQPRQVKHQKHPHHPHHVVPKHESGYTDEAAMECHDLIDRAEEEAHVRAFPISIRNSAYPPFTNANMQLQLHDPNSMYATEGIPGTKGTAGTAGTASKMGKKMGGLEGSSTGSTGGPSATEKVTQTGKNIKSTVGEKMEQMKDAMHLNK